MVDSDDDFEEPKPKVGRVVKKERCVGKGKMDEDTVEDDETGHRITVKICAGSSYDTGKSM